MSTTHQPTARKRITLACNGCRSKRTKCDGAQPVCSACQYRQQGCEYSQAESNRKRPTNAYIAALEARVATLEKQLELSHTHDHDHDHEHGHDCDDDERVEVPVASDHDSVLEGDGDHVDELVDAMGCFTLGDTGELRFFGASSNFNIIRANGLRVPSSVEARNRGIAAAKQMPTYFEPTDELRDALLADFWMWQNSWQYIVPRESFVRDLYVDKSQRYCTPLLLNAVLALSSRYSSRLELRTDPSNANTAGEMFVAQAKVMLHHECEAPTTSTAQATALLGLFYAAVDNEGLGFMYIGMAARMAMNLGLHSDCSAYAVKGLISEEDVAARNVAFWGLYVLDKLYCLGMGRPASIQEYNITTDKLKPLKLDTSALTEYQAAISRPHPTDHITENYLQMCELLLSTSEVIDQLYAQRYTWTKGEREDRVMKAHFQAVKLFDSLPKSLKISNSSLQPSAPYVYQLHIQYHHSILLLHRPFFKLLYPGKHSIDYDPAGGDIHSRASRNAAIKTSKIAQIYRKVYTNRHMPISAVHPIFTAAIIHLLHLKSGSEHGRNEALQGLKVCILSLYEMNTNWDWSNRSIRAIQMLAMEWDFDLSTLGLVKEVREENMRQFEIYEQGCLSMKPWSGDGPAQGLTMDDFGEMFEAWNYDQGFVNLPFNGFDDLWQ